MRELSGESCTAGYPRGQQLTGLAVPDHRTMRRHRVGPLGPDATEARPVGRASVSQRVRRVALDPISR